jgi:predicted amidohydrolase
VKATCALVQMNFSVHVAENIDRGCDYVREAGRGGAEIICLPELATTE